MLLLQYILSTVRFIEAKCCWRLYSLIYGEVSFREWALGLKSSFMVNNPIRGSTKNTRRMKPDSSFFNCFPCLLGEGLDSFLFMVNSPLYCFHSWEVVFCKKAFRKRGSNSFGFQNTTKVAGSKTAPPCQMPGRIVTLANSDPTDFQYIFFKYSGLSS